MVTLLLLSLEPELHFISAAIKKSHALQAKLKTHVDINSELFIPQLQFAHGDAERETADAAFVWPDNKQLIIISGRF